MGCFRSSSVSLSSVLPDRGAAPVSACRDGCWGSFGAESRLLRGEPLTSQTWACAPPKDPLWISQSGRCCGSARPGCWLNENKSARPRLRSRACGGGGYTFSSLRAKRSMLSIHFCPSLHLLLHMGPRSGVRTCPQHHPTSSPPPPPFNLLCKQCAAPRQASRLVTNNPLCPTFQLLLSYRRPRAAASYRYRIQIGPPLSCLFVHQRKNA